MKFGGYLLAGLALKRIQPGIHAGVARIAATRTGLGVILGPLCTMGFMWMVSHYSPQQIFNQTLPAGMYSMLALLRLFVWALVINLFTRGTQISAGKLWALALAGAVWSCLLDIPGILLALVSPGKIPVC